MKICYVILHYKNIDDTCKCIESLKKTASGESQFIIIDNGSNDKSGEILAQKYLKDKRIIILEMEENMGFSKGNNAGYQYAKTQYKPDFIVITNNDVVFYQEEFEKNIEKIYVKTKFDVLGPDVYVPRHGDHQNPLFKTPITIETLEKEIEEYKYYFNNPQKFSNRLKVHAFKNMLCSKSRLINWLYASLRGKDHLDYRKEYENVGLQGSCLIFSKNFIINEDKAFVPEPFLYEEEVFLFYRCQKEKYKMVYNPSIAIRHEEAASFNNEKRTNIEKISFMLKHHIASRELLLSYLKDNGVRI